MTLAKFPLYKALGPSSEITLEKQFAIPVYLGTSPDWILGLASWVYNNSLTLSIGATADLETAAEIPPAMKSMKKFFFFSGTALISFLWLLDFLVI